MSYAYLSAYLCTMMYRIRSSVVGSIFLVSLVASGELWRRPMRKKFARRARLVREIAEFLMPILKVIKLIVEIVNKAANCDDRKLQIQISVAR